MAKRGGPKDAGRVASSDARTGRRKRRNRARTGRRAPEGNEPARRNVNPESVAAPPPEPAPTATSEVPRAAAQVPPAVSQGSLRAIEPPASGLRRYFADVWRLRPAFAYFIQRYMRKRYGRTFFGYLWFFIPVLLPLFIGALVFGGILGVGVPGVPYLLYFAVTLGAWLLFSQTAYLATRSLEISRSEIRRIYVPRLLALTAGMTLPFITFLVYGLIIAAVTGFYVVTRGEFYLELRPATLLVLPAIAMLIAFGWSIGLWFSTLAPRARDVRRLSSYVLGFWYFLTPVMYPIDEIPSGYQFLASLNPATAPIELVKDGLLDVGDVTTLGLACYLGWLVVATVGGLVIFVTRERRDMAFY